MGEFFTQLLTFTVIGVVTGSAYAIAASGLVVTYATSNVFNIAHGAVGMFMAFVYWELAVNRGLPTFVALVLVVGVIAPLFGALIERVLIRRFTDAPVAVTLVITVGLLTTLIVVAQQIWPPTARRVDRFFGDSSVRIASINVSAHDIITFLTAAAVAVGLYLFLNRSRTGIAMRAMVDNRELVALYGGRPKLLGSFSWALGASLAALAGILLVPVVLLDYVSLTLLVISAYAAAMVGRLKNLPRTFIGAMVLGLLQSYFLLVVNYLPEGFDPLGLLRGTRASLPTIFLFAVMLLLPQEKLRVGTVAGTKLPAIPTYRAAVIWGTVFVAAVVVLVNVMSTGNVSTFGQALVLSLIMLSLVVLTGYGGVVSLAQLTFAGFGALTVVKGFNGQISLLSILAAGVVAALVGGIVALPALRLKGLYLALGTLAFAVAMEKLVFDNGDLGFNLGGNALIERPTLLGISLQSERAFTVAVAVAFVILSIVVLRTRRSRFGRFLLAIRDSQIACGTLGLSLVGTRVKVFMLSAGLAGIAGAFFGGMRVSVGSFDFTMFASLPLLLLAVIGGITTPTGALLGGLFLGMLPVIQEKFPALGAVMYLLILVALVSLGRNPNGIVGLTGDLVNRVRGREAKVGVRTYVPTAPKLSRTEEVASVGVA